LFQLRLWVIRGTHSDIGSREYTSWRRIQYMYRWRTYLPDGRTLATYVSWWRTYCGDYIFRRRSCSWCTYSTDVRILSTYVFYWRTHSTAVRIGDYIFYPRMWFRDVRILPTYVRYRRTYFPDVRGLSTYVRDATPYAFLWRTHREMQIRDYASADGDFGTTLLEIENSGQHWIPSTQNSGFRGSDAENRLGLIFHALV